MKLFARIIEGSQADAIFQAECTQDGYNKLWNIGKELWDVGKLSKYEIGVFTDSLQLFWSIRPDQWNFKENRHKNCFIEYAEEELKSFLSPDFQSDTLEMEYAKMKQALWMKNPSFLEKAGISNYKKFSLDKKVETAKEKIETSEKNKAEKQYINDNLSL